ncbi:MAG: helix-hairpin-helix domain-containing protein, partial [Treponema sp.]|nr:helix-hairpin-helix domain-containing protein [Treponema sp.]
LSETLDEVVTSVVNNVGVNLNTASVSLLKYVSGINSSLARKIVQYRDEKGKIGSREELVSVPGMGPKSFEQCAGFLKIPESTESLDNTWVHPENYAAAKIIRQMIDAGTVTSTGGLSAESLSLLKEKHNLGDTTIRDIIEELRKPNRDPRDGFPKPIIQKGLVTFEDLNEGMTVTGKIKNVVDFGAFVDLGIKETALVHISELSDSFVKDPMELVKVGDILEFRILSLDRDRRRISLSRKSEKPVVEPKAPANREQTQQPAEQLKRPPLRPAPGQQRSPQQKQPQHAIAGQPNRDKPAWESQRSSQRELQRDSRSESRDDGTMYNPFADAFKKRDEAKKRR